MTSFSPTPSEITLSSQILAVADTQKVGIVTGDAAVNILSGANLSAATLGEIWAIADKDNNGFLTRKGLGIALRLIGYAQHGEAVKEALINKPGPLAYIEGFSPPSVAQSSPSLNSTPQSSSALPPATTFPLLSQQDKLKFLKLFIGCGPVNGLLSGEKARDVFVKSKLPYDKLSQIWTLADRHARGALDSSDFIIGMYLIQASMSNPSFTLPAVLPKWLYDQATDHSTGVSSNTTGGSSGLGSPLHSVFQSNRQNTASGTGMSGLNAVKTQVTGSYTLPSPGLSGSNNPVMASKDPMVKNTQFNQSWAISVEERSSSDALFDGLDIQRRGYLESDVAVPFMLKSNLPGEELAQIWDLADLDSDGHLTRDGFAIAMHVIKLRMAGGDIPSTSPEFLVPSSGKPAADKQVDLLIDESPPASPSQSPPGLGQSNIYPLPVQMSPSLQGTGQNGMSSMQKTSTQPQSLQPTRSDPGKDLLDDDSDTKNNFMQDISVDIGNTQNQLSSINRSLTSTKSERTTVEQITSDQETQLSQLRTQLALARASYESESQLLGSLRERSAVQSAEIQKTREELITAESELSAVKLEKAEVERSVLKAKEEIRDLHRRMKETTSQTDQLKTEMDQLRKDARQKKGLLAIAKKQLVTAEAEYAKTTKEREVVQNELETLQAEMAAASGQATELPSTVLPTPLNNSNTEFASNRAVSPAQSLLAAAIPLPATPQSTTPLPVPRQSTNPFERLVRASTDPDPTVVFNVPPRSNIETTPSAFPEIPLLSSVEPNMHLQAVTDPSTLPMSGMSPSDDEAPFLTPPTTANLFDPEAQQHPIEALNMTTSITIDNALDKSDTLSAPLQELEINESDTSVSDDEPLGTKLSYSRKPNHSSNNTYNEPPEGSSHFPHSPTTISNDTQVSAGAVALPGKKSPSLSGRSSPKRSQSPDGPFTTRTLSSHFTTGIMDHFGTTNAYAEVEPVANDTAPPVGKILPESVPKASTISDFDEAFGTLPNTANNVASTFEFGSTFDDDFDFASATNVSDQKVTPVDPSQSMKVEPSVTASSTPFEHTLNSLMKESNQPTGSTTTNNGGGPSTDYQTKQRISPDDSNGNFTVTLNDAFGLSSMTPPSMRQVEKAVTPDIPNTAHIPLASNMELLNPSPVKQAGLQENHSNSPRPTSPAELAATPLPASPRQSHAPTIPSRTVSPPLRASSPRLRVSSKGASDSKPEPSKHKLSIRFPFGRKDKSKDKEDKSKDKEDKAKDKEDKSKDKEDKRGGYSHAQQIPHHTSHFLSPVSDSPIPGTITPAVDDDAEPVKQLAAMGFSRTQSIAALETHGYDVQAALNSLLGVA